MFSTSNFIMAEALVGEERDGDGVLVGEGRDGAISISSVLWDRDSCI